ncbi:DUF4765 family protein [Streptomyces kronopolitis]|uniref:DUF4765 family protein n=1 Tax=Streptomyces kronopolitis TaxID=1612435 RepID=UPI00369FF0D9
MYTSRRFTKRYTPSLPPVATTSAMPSIAPMRSTAAVAPIARSPRYITQAIEWMVDDDPTSEPIEDDFDSIVSEQKIPVPTPDSDVQKIVSSGVNQQVTLWRGVKGFSAAEMERLGSAGGVPADPTVVSPGVGAARHQVAHGRSLPEFTSDKHAGWSFGNWLVVARVETRYLARGSKAEQGWICDPAAPITVLALVDRTMGQEARLTGNAS